MLLTFQRNDIINTLFYQVKSKLFVQIHSNNMILLIVEANKRLHNQVYSLEFASPTMLSTWQSSLNLSNTVPLTASCVSCFPFGTTLQHYHFRAYSTGLGKGRTTECGTVECVTLIKACREKQTQVIHSSSKTNPVWDVL